MSETEDPRTFNKSLAMLQIVDTVLYLISALIIYKYVGPNVQSPAILSLNPLMSKIAWGLAIPTVSQQELSFFPFLILVANKSRRFFLVSSWDMLPANKSMCAFSGDQNQTRCTTAVSSPSAPGSLFVSVSGLFLGWWRSPFLSLMICWVWSYVPLITLIEIPC